MIAELDHVGLRYGSGPEVLRDVRLSIEDGALVLLTGASGAGKSSLLRIIHGSLLPSRGQVRLLGQDLASVSRDGRARLRRRIGFIFQDFRLLDHLSAYDNVALPLRLAGVAESTIRRQVIELLEWVGLGPHLDASPASLSGGEQQRIAIARAVIGKPELLLADEPTGNVDDALAQRLLALIVELNRQGTAVLLATHSQSVVGWLGGRHLHLQDGEVGPGERQEVAA